jgi:hypothetical protein
VGLKGKNPRGENSPRHRRELQDYNHLLITNITRFDFKIMALGLTAVPNQHKMLMGKCYLDLN